MLKKSQFVLVLSFVVLLTSVFVISNTSEVLSSIEPISTTEARTLINRGEVEKLELVDERPGRDTYNLYLTDGSIREIVLESDRTLEEQGIDTSKTVVELNVSNPNQKVIDVLMALVPVLIIGAALAFSVYAIANAAGSTVRHKPLWILLIILTFPIGAIIYYFVVIRKSPKK